MGICGLLPIQKAAGIGFQPAGEGQHDLLTAERPAGQGGSGGPRSAALQAEAYQRSQFVHRQADGVRFHVYGTAGLAYGVAQRNGYGVSGFLSGGMSGQNGAPGSRHFDAPLRPKARGLHGLGRALFPRPSAGKQRQGRPAPFQRPKHQGAVALPPDEGQKRL